MSALRKQLEQEIIRRSASRLASIMGTSQPTSGALSRAPQYRRGLGFWGEVISGVVSAASSVYVAKETSKANAKLAEVLAEAEAKKLLAETNLALAQANTMEKQAQLVAQQSELQKIIAGMEFSGVQKYLLAGAGVLAFVLIGMVAYRKMGARKARR
jgi:hypothetical protein